MNKKEYHRQYYLKNKKKFLLNQKRTNPTWRKKNKEKIKQYKKDYYKNNSEKMRAYYRAYREKNLEKVKGVLRIYGRNNRDKINKYKLKKLENIAKRKKPKKCEICGREDKVVFDHCHKTGEFRGWICHKCNIALGLINDDIDILKGLIKYLKKYEDIGR